MDKKVIITQFKWAGALGPFRIKSKCAECDLTTSILKDMIKREFKDLKIKLEIKPWLNNFFYCFLRFTWHPPIIMVNDKKFYQFSHKQPLFDRKKLIELVTKYLAKK